MKSHLSRVAAALCITSITGCTFLPSSGPSGFSIKSQSGHGNCTSTYQVLPINDRVLEVISAHTVKAPYLAAAGRQSDSLFGERGLEAFKSPKDNCIVLGDVLSVSIYETDATLFTPSMAAGQIAVSPMTTLPHQSVDQTGDISVPFIGRIKVLGKTPAEVEKSIREGLSQKTSDPQVIVALIDRKGGNLVSVAGDVRVPAMIPVSFAGTKLIDAISAAGGSLSQPYDTMVTVTREGKMRSDSLQDVFNNPIKNINLQAGDNVVLRKRALTFLTFGTTGRVGSNSITVEDLSLTDALAASGGPSDSSANPATVFVYRQEPVAMLRDLGKKVLGGDGKTAPVIYQLDLHDPKGFFLASRFVVRDRDLLYYAPAGSSAVLKFMGLVNTFIAPAVSGVGIASSASILAGP